MLSCDDLPQAVIIRRKDNGQILKTNRIAGKLFGLRASSSLAIKKIRPSGLLSRSVKKTGYLEFSQVLHQHLKGKTFSMTVLRKELVWGGINCWADFLEEVQSDHPIKTQILQASLDAFISIDENQRVCDWNPSAGKIFGWKKKEVVGLRLVDLIVHDGYKKKHVNGFDRSSKRVSKKF